MSAEHPPASALSDDAIRQRAYYLWEADGRPDGRSDHYWQLALSEAQAASAEVPPAKAKPKATKVLKAAANEKPKKAARKAEEKPAKKATKPRAAGPAKAK